MWLFIHIIQCSINFNSFYICFYVLILCFLSSLIHWLHALDYKLNNHRAMMTSHELHVALHDIQHKNLYLPCISQDYIYREGTKAVKLTPQSFILHWSYFCSLSACILIHFHIFWFHSLCKRTFTLVTAWIK